MAMKITKAGKTLAILGEDVQVPQVGSTLTIEKVWQLTETSAQESTDTYKVTEVKHTFRLCFNNRSVQLIEVVVV